MSEDREIIERMTDEILDVMDRSNWIRNTIQWIAKPYEEEEESNQRYRKEITTSFDRLDPIEYEGIAQNYKSDPTVERFFYLVNPDDLHEVERAFDRAMMSPVSLERNAIVTTTPGMNNFSGKAYVASHEEIPTGVIVIVNESYMDQVLIYIGPTSIMRE
jgi:hypothetical protein